MRLPSFSFGNDGVCTYCGDPGNCFDHCIPVSHQTNQIRKSKMRVFGPVTWSCSHCNSILSNKGFDTFYERCEYIHEALERRLEPVHWSQKELKTLHGWLRVRVANEMQRRLWMFNRADWFDTRDFWLNIENLTWEPRLIQTHKAFHPVLFDYFRSTIALAQVVFNQCWTARKEE